ncbi:TPA: flagellar biosynthesis anti-sigma factor FlgM [Candidatus Poribacteria bacterium]|nr:flagellar biosynthesis anti-sigma factor FlgM [Candidatus Poribacteria bacterium]
MPPIDQNGKINSSNPLRPRQQTEKVQTSKNNSYQQVRNDQVTGSEEDKFVLSSQSSEVNSIKERVHQLPDVDMEKVERLRQLIKSGDYKVDSQKMADNILAASLSLTDDE